MDDFGNTEEVKTENSDYQSSESQPEQVNAGSVQVEQPSEPEIQPEKPFEPVVETTSTSNHAVDAELEELLGKQKADELMEDY